ncbi:MAG: element excision factor XisH family protein [Microcystis sp.]
MKYKDAELFADLAAEKPLAAERNGRKIVVEIKSFLISRGDRGATS